jgi:hypothetical protein
MDAHAIPTAATPPEDSPYVISLSRTAPTPDPLISPPVGGTSFRPVLPENPNLL